MGEPLKTYEVDERVYALEYCCKEIIRNAADIYGKFKCPQNIKIVIEVPTYGAPNITVARETEPCFELY